MGYFYNNIDSKNITSMTYGKSPLVAVAYNKKIVWRSPYSVILLSVNPDSIGHVNVTATGDVISCFPNNDKSMFIIKAKLGGSATIKISPSTGYDIKQLNVNGVSQGTTSSYTFSSLTPKNTMYLWLEATEAPFVNFLERSDLPGTYYSSLYSAMHAVKDSYPNGVLTKDVTISCIMRGTEVRDNSGVKPTNDRLYLANLKEFNKDSLFTLTIDGRGQYTLDGLSLGIIHVDKCDNIIFKDIYFKDYSNFAQAVSPEEMAAIYSTGEIGRKNNNIVVQGCTFDGDYYHTDSKHYYADFGVDCKLTSNVIIDNCSFIKGGAISIKCTDVDILELKRTTASSYHKQSMAHSTICTISGASLLNISDCVFNGESLREYGITLTDCKEMIFKRNTFNNFASTVLDINSSNIGSLIVESCLFFQCLTVYYASYFKFLGRIGQNLSEFNLHNNTIYMDGTGTYFQEAFSVDGNVDIFRNYNNIFIDKQKRVNAFMTVTGDILEYKANNNVYKALQFKPGDRFNAVKILSCESFKISNSIKDERNIKEYQALGYDVNSFALDDTEKLLNVEENGGDYALMDKYATTYLSDATIRSIYDIAYKKIGSNSPTAGAYNLGGIVWDETTDTNNSYHGVNTVDGALFNNTLRYLSPSDDIIILKSDTVDRTNLMKFILVSDYKSIMRYGNSISAAIDCISDSVGMYQSNVLYDVVIYKGSSMVKYDDVLEAGIGRATLNLSVNNSFPLIGNTVRLSTKTKWAQNMEFTMEDSVGIFVQENRPNTSQNEAIDVTVLGAGDLTQNVVAKNSKFNSTRDQMLYAMSPKSDPYFTVEASLEVVRVNEMVDIYIRPEHGFDLSTVKSAVIKVYVENTDTSPIKTLSGISYDDSAGCYHVGKFTINNRGYYDVEVELTNSGNVSIAKRVNKLITVTPRLAARPTQSQIDNNEYTTIVADSKYGVELKCYETGVNDLYCIFNLKEGQTNNDSGFYQWLHLDALPVGKDAYTIVLKKDYTYKEGYYYSRVLVGGNVDSTKSNANGTPQFSYNTPLVFTIDQDFPLVLYGVYYSTVAYNNNTRNTVWDGRGYYNLNKGIKFDRYSKDIYWEDAYMLLNGTSDVEIFEVEICNTNFTAMMSKTDPTAKNPFFWRENWIYYNLIWHHSYIHDTGGEGCYLGYFTPDASDVTYTGETMTVINLKGEEVLYEKGKVYKKMAHRINGLRLYRNFFDNCGYDNVQVSNSINSEFCYNKINRSSFKNEKDQATGVTLQSMDGLIYNNVVINHNGPAYQLGPYDKGAEFFNNTCITFQNTDAIQFIWTLENPGQNPSGGTSGVINNTITYLIHNNTLIAGRFTANGRNTVQMQKIFFTDNIMVNKGQNFASMATETLALWESQKEGNAIYTTTQFFNMLKELKIADVYNNDFRIASDSPLISMGTGKNFKFDARGYKNWFSDTYPVGAYMGIFRRETVPISGVSILNKPTEIISGTQLELSFTPSNTTQKSVNYSSSNPAIATVSSEGFVTVVSNGSVVISVSSTINPSINDEFTCNCIYKDPPTKVTITTDSGNKIYLGIKVNATAAVSPSGAIQHVTWALEGGEQLIDVTPTSASFIAETPGIKVLKASHKDFPSISNLVTFTAEEAPAAGNIRISFCSIKENGTVDVGNSYVEGTNNLGFLNANGTYPIKDISGNSVATFKAIDKLSVLADSAHSSYSTKGDIAPLNGFLLNQLQGWTYYAGSNGTFKFSITGIKGRYKISIFASNNYTVRPASSGAFYTLDVSGTPIALTPPVIENNLSQWMEQEVEIGDSGLIVTTGNNGGTNGYSYIPINAIVLQPV